MKRSCDGETKLNKYVEFDKEAWFNAAKIGDTETIGGWIAQTRPQKIVNTQDKYGWTALMYASRWGCLGVAKVLLKNEADVNIQTKWGDTALMIASNNCYLDVVKVLLENGADVNIKDEDGGTALTYTSYPNVVKALQSWRSFLPEFSIFYKRSWK